MAAAISAAAIFVLLAAVISIIGYRKYVRPAGVYEQIGGTAAEVMATPLVDSGPTAEPFTVRVLQLVGEKVPAAPADAMVARRYLMAAGYRSDNALPVYYGLKVACGVVLFVLGLALYTHVSSARVLQMVFLIAAGVGGYFGPNLLLDRLVARRQERIRFSLPDTLDLMVISVEAGLGLDQAVNSVARELATTHKDISDEFNLVTLEMRAGKRRAEALKNLVDRTGEADLRKLIAILLQADRFGTSMADSLRAHSDFMRMKRTQEAEERANKVGVKLIFPIFFFILPAMLLVCTGPALIQIYRELLPLMRSVRTK